MRCEGVQCVFSPLTALTAIHNLSCGTHATMEPRKGAPAGEERGCCGSQAAVMEALTWHVLHSPEAVLHGKSGCGGGCKRGEGQVASCRPVLRSRGGSTPHSPPGTLPCRPRPSPRHPRAADATLPAGPAGGSAVTAARMGCPGSNQTGTLLHAEAKRSSMRCS